MIQLLIVYITVHLIKFICVKNRVFELFFGDFKLLQAVSVKQLEQIILPIISAKVFI